jgi:hypothetical protein
MTDDRGAGLRVLHLCLWENADPELQPQVETARRALACLGTENVN